MVQPALMENSNVCMLDERSGYEFWSHLKSNENIGHHIGYLTQLVEKGGPDTEDYYELEACIEEINSQVKNGEIGDDQLSVMRGMMSDTFSLETIQGFVFQKPHGYAGDYEIIDRIYNHYICPLSHLSKWDAYLQGRPAAQAVRNRVDYLSETIINNLKEGKEIRVLNLASGPGRDMLQFFTKFPEAKVNIDCLEQDSNAIKHASELCHEHMDKITFIKKNAMRFSTLKKYDLIWSAVLFDYFSDRVFEFMIKKLKNMVADGGEIVVGNFSSVNPSKAYMEFFDWNLHHRSPQKLRSLAMNSGIVRNKVFIGKEETGVNLFLHIRN